MRAGGGTHRPLRGAPEKKNNVESFFFVIIAQRAKGPPRKKKRKVVVSRVHDGLSPVGASFVDGDRCTSDERSARRESSVYI